MDQPTTTIKLSKFDFLKLLVVDKSHQMLIS